MDRLQYLLSKLAEEASEVSQIALKSQQFGLDEVYPKVGISNKERIHEELNDLMAIVGMLNDEFYFSFTNNFGHHLDKEDKVNRYFEVSKNLWYKRMISDDT